MKYLKILEDKRHIDSLCLKYKIENWTINNDLFVDVDGDVRLDNKGLKNLPIIFGRVCGDFECSWNELTSLEGCPKEVGSWFNCCGNQLTTLKGGPKEVGSGFSCPKNHLSSLEGCPENIGDCFQCSLNQLKIIDYLPLKIGNIIDFSYNEIKDIRVERKSYVFNGRCYLKDNPINKEFKEWNGNLSGFIKNLNRLRRINEILIP